MIRAWAGSFARVARMAFSDRAQGLAQRRRQRRCAWVGCRLQTDAVAQVEQLVELRGASTSSRRKASSTDPSSPVAPKSIGQPPVRSRTRRAERGDMCDARSSRVKRRSASVRRRTLPVRHRSRQTVQLLLRAFGDDETSLPRQERLRKPRRTSLVNEVPEQQGLPRHQAAGRGRPLSRVVARVVAAALTCPARRARREPRSATPWQGSARAGDGAGHRSPGPAGGRRRRTG
jgi:hypothetical protein